MGFLRCMMVLVLDLDSVGLFAGVGCCWIVSLVVGFLLFVAESAKNVEGVSRRWRRKRRCESCTWC